jgi:hypothetical protein
MVERVLVSGGAPTYPLKNGVIVLDGIEWLACGDGNATRKWVWNYPSDEKANAERACCASGGNTVRQL